MKKVFYLFLIVLTAFAFTACKAEEYKALTPQSGSEDIYLDVPRDSYLLESETILYSIKNKSENIIQVVLIPILERETSTGWEKINPIGIGFCGTPDSIDKKHSGELPLSWFEGLLTSGKYRLSFEVVDEKYNRTALISDVFYLISSDITMKIEEGSLSAKGAKLILTSNSTYECIYGDYFKLERKSDNFWEEVSAVIQDYMFNSIGYILEAGKTREMIVDWQWLYGELENGEYRITKDFIYATSDENNNTGYITAEFTLGLSEQ